MALLNNKRADERYGGDQLPVKIVDYTLATLPDAAANTGNMIFVTDATPVAPCFSDGSTWISLVTGITAV